MIIFILMVFTYCGDMMPSTFLKSEEICYSQKEAELKIELMKLEKLGMNTYYEFKLYKIDLDNKKVDEINLRSGR